VVKEGEVGVGDEMKLVHRDPNGVPVSEITRLYTAKQYSDADVGVVQRVLQIEAVPAGWKDYFRERLEHGQSEV
jgi:MOSC domain-containing protein YiiM